VAKKNKMEFTEHMIKLLGYKWEFLRRNYEYIDDYQQYKNRSGLLRNKEMFHHFEAHICNKYGIRLPYDPTVPFDFDLIKKAKTRKKISQDIIFSDRKWKKNREIILNLMHGLETGVFFEIPERQKIGRPGLEKTDKASPSEDELRKQHTIEIKIDLNFPKDKILQEVERIVTEWQRMRAKVIPKKTEKMPKFKELDLYLEAYRLKNQGWSLDRLAKKYFPEEVDKTTNKATDEAKKKVATYYDKCWELIYGGYRHIR